MKNHAIELTSLEREALLLELLLEIVRDRDPESAEALVYPAVFRQLTGADDPMRWIGSRKKGSSVITLPENETERQCWKNLLGFLTKRSLKNGPLIKGYEEALRLLLCRFTS